MTIEKIFEWAWRQGLDVSLTSRSHQVAGEEYDRLRSRQGTDFVSMYKFVVDSPVLTFSRRGISQTVTAMNWAEMKILLKNTHKRIWSNLCCEELTND